MDGDSRSQATEALRALVSDKDDDVSSSAKVALQRIAKQSASEARSEV